MADPNNIAAAYSGARLQAVMDILEAEIARMTQAVEAKTFRSLEEGRLSPDMALSAWQEIHGYKKLLRKLETRIQVGQSAGEEEAYTLDIG